MSPRIITVIYRARASRWALALFMFTFMFSAGTLGRIEEWVPGLCMFAAIALNIMSIGAFVLLVDYVGKSLRPVALLSAIGAEGARVIADVYPISLVDRDASLTPQDVVPLAEPDRVIDRMRTSGIVVAFDAARLAESAGRADCTIELVPQVGDFVAKGDPLFTVYGTNAGNVDADELAGSIAFGAERTFPQDPLFALRIIVDVASKALSPAINDPTTAVLAIDQLHHLLRNVGRRRLDTGVVRDASGTPRFVYRTPDWEDFVRLAVTEIRHFGITSIQVVRRMRAMLENLAGSLPSERVRPLAAELVRLHAAVERAFPDAWDREMAAIGDSQGMGSPVTPGVSHVGRASAGSRADLA
jgi:uncharacterized membrane protein